METSSLWCDVTKGSRDLLTPFLSCWQTRLKWTLKVVSVLTGGCKQRAKHGVHWVDFWPLIALWKSDGAQGEKYKTLQMCITVGLVNRQGFTHKLWWCEWTWLPLVINLHAPPLTVDLREVLQWSTSRATCLLISHKAISALFCAVRSVVGAVKNSQKRPSKPIDPLTRLLPRADSLMTRLWEETADQIWIFNLVQLIVSKWLREKDFVRQWRQSASNLTSPRRRHLTQKKKGKKKKSVFTLRSGLSSAIIVVLGVFTQTLSWTEIVHMSRMIHTLA